MSVEEADAQLEEYWRFLFKVAGGWLYWSLEQTLHTDINFILVAFEGHKEQLEALFGTKKDETKLPPVVRGHDGKPVTMTPNVFDIQFDVKRNLRAKIRGGKPN